MYYYSLYDIYVDESVDKVKLPYVFVFVIYTLCNLCDVYRYDR